MVMDITAKQLRQNKILRYGLNAGLFIVLGIIFVIPRIVSESSSGKNNGLFVLTGSVMVAWGVLNIMRILDTKALQANREAEPLSYDITQFIQKIDEFGWGIGAFNTYHHDGINYCYIMVSQRGGSGRFLKKECTVPEFEKTCGEIIDILQERASK